MSVRSVDPDGMLMSAPARAAQDAAVATREKRLGLVASGLFLVLAFSGLVRADLAFAIALLVYAGGRIGVGMLQRQRAAGDHRQVWAQEARVAAADLLRSAQQLQPDLRTRIERVATLATALADRLEDRTTVAGRLAQALTTDLPILARAAKLAASRRHDPVAAADLARAVDHFERMLDDAARAWDQTARDELQSLLAILARRAAERGLG